MPCVPCLGEVAPAIFAVKWWRCGNVMFLWGDKGEYKMNIWWLVKTKDKASKRHILHLIWALPLASALAPSENDRVRYQANISLLYYDLWIYMIRGRSLRLVENWPSQDCLDILLRIKVPKLPISTFCVNEPPHQLWQGSVQQPQECSSAFKSNCHQL